MSDKYEKFTSLPHYPANDAFEITPSDNTVFSQATTHLYVGTGGNVRVMMASSANTSANLVNVPSGTLLPIRAQMVYQSETDADNLVGMY